MKNRNVMFLGALLAVEATLQMPVSVKVSGVVPTVRGPVTVQR